MRRHNCLREYQLVHKVSDGPNEACSRLATEHLSSYTVLSADHRGTKISIQLYVASNIFFLIFVHMFANIASFDISPINFCYYAKYWFHIVESGCLQTGFGSDVGLTINI